MALAACSGTTSGSAGSNTTTTLAKGASAAGTSVLSGPDQAPWLLPFPAPAPTALAPSASAALGAGNGGCGGLADPGWTARCLQANTGPATLIGLIETRTGADGQRPVWQASVWVEHGATVTGALHAGTPDDVDYWSWINVTTADVLGTGHQELVFGFEDQGTGQILDIDAVAADGGSVLGRSQISVYKGTATVAGNQVVTYYPVYKSTDPNCCPSGGDASQTVVFTHGAWTVVRTRAVPAPAAGASFPNDFGDPGLS
jgi:hypothetical protein